jgi:hypothetical protein
MYHRNPQWVAEPGALSQQEYTEIKPKLHGGNVRSTFLPQIKADKSKER